MTNYIQKTTTYIYGGALISSLLCFSISPSLSKTPHKSSNTTQLRTALHTQPQSYNNWFDIIKIFRQEPDTYKPIILLSINAGAQNLFNRDLRMEILQTHKVDYKHYARTAKAVSSYLVELAKLSKNEKLLHIYQQRLALYDKALSGEITENTFNQKRKIIDAGFNKVALHLRDTDPTKLREAFTASYENIKLITQFVYFSARDNLKHTQR